METPSTSVVSPPPPPPMDAFSRCVQKRAIMRKFNWDTIPCERVLGKRNLWTMQASLGDFELDTERIKELFCNKDNRQPMKTVPRPCKRDFCPSEQGIQKISLLSSKKSMNIAIVLKQFKRPVYRLVRDIREGNATTFKGGTLKNLCKLLPAKEEVKKLLAFEGTLSHLTEADQFMVRLIKLPGYEERIQSLVLLEEFFPIMDDLRRLIAVMTAAAKELLESDDLQSIIRLVLKVGNYMNEGCYTGSAIGFKMGSLLRLADTKANKPGITLMHYVATQAQDVDPSLLNFPRRLKYIRAAARICTQEVRDDLQKEIGRVASVKEDSSKHDDLNSQMERFLKRADLILESVDISWKEFQDTKSSLAEYLCEDPASFKLEECCSIFKSFSEKFDQAVAENQQRREAERRRERRQSLRPGSSADITASSSRGVSPQTDSDMERALASLLVAEGGTPRRRSRLCQSTSNLSEVRRAIENYGQRDNTFQIGPHIRNRSNTTSRP
ncbi:FH2 domain containing 3 [Alosa pseudoharengus]|uniref:FH2 domain containing 3 n=1 Tax=Alosa pseudoharengus TaxID=34774 RepID=UPI003F8A618A